MLDTKKTGRLAGHDQGQTPLEGTPQVFDSVKKAAVGVGMRVGGVTQGSVCACVEKGHSGRWGS